MRRRGLFLPAQCRAARGLLAWSQAWLADVSGLQLELIEQFEAGDCELFDAEVAHLGGTFNRAGVIALPEQRGGLGVRFSLPASRSPPDF